mmetsp:Transcript_13009/g.23156  ORF Transcript_13009/g.23156 Transcript_13009/m.23156 type:complete len:210 (-) Transcript_13009:273-902(-)
MATIIILYNSTQYYIVVQICPTTSFFGYLPPRADHTRCCHKEGKQKLSFGFHPNSPAAAAGRGRRRRRRRWSAARRPRRPRRGARPPGSWRRGRRCFQSFGQHLPPGVGFGAAWGLCSYPQPARRHQVDLRLCQTGVDHVGAPLTGAPSWVPQTDFCPVHVSYPQPLYLIWIAGRLFHLIPRQLRCQNLQPVGGFDLCLQCGYDSHTIH